MDSSLTLLEQLRSKTTVDCDTLDMHVAASLGPFQDCTSNQAIAYLELQHSNHDALIKEAVKTAKGLSDRYLKVKVESLAVEISMVKLALTIIPHLKGRVHIQVNPYDAYSIERTVSSALRIVEIFALLSPAIEAKQRVCIKIPSTWEGLKACQILERDFGIATLATTLFSFEQAVLAAEANCSYIAPYVNELAVHFEKGYVDPSPNNALCVQAQLYYQRQNVRTAVLPASLTSINECMLLAGVSHITISPPLLEQLASRTALDQGTQPFLENPTFREDAESTLPMHKLRFIDNEEAFRMSFTRRDHGLQEIKQVKAINIFAGFQDQLEAMMASSLV